MRGDRRSMRIVSRHRPACGPVEGAAIRSRRPTTRNPSSVCSARLAVFSGNTTPCRVQMPDASVDSMRARSSPGLLGPRAQSPQPLTATRGVCSRTASGSPTSCRRASVHNYPLTRPSLCRRKIRDGLEDRPSCVEQSARCLRGRTSFENSPPEGCSRNSSSMFAKLSPTRKAPSWGPFFFPQLRAENQSEVRQLV